MLAAIRSALLDAAALLVPVRCAGCGSADRGLCDSCAGQLRPVVRATALADGTPAFTALDYDGVVRRVILSFKEQNRTDAARPLAAALAAAIAHAVTPGVELAAVPTSRSAWRRRGYDPVALLLRRAAYRPVSVLAVARGTSAQKTLSVAERAANRHGSLRAVRPLTGRSFLLVDDVLTTGATLVEAARAVRAAGGTVTAVVAVAYTPRLFPPSELTQSVR